MILKNMADALVDKVILSGFIVEEIKDWERLEREDVMYLKQNDKCPIEVEGARFSCIHIKEEAFIREFRYCRCHGNIRGHMELTVPDVDGKHNLNCLTLDELRANVREAFRLIEERYGIVVRYNEVKLKYLELNKTIETEFVYDEYKRVIRLMDYVLNGRLRCKKGAVFRGKDNHSKRATENRIEESSRMKSSGEKGLTVKFYDKRRELAEKYGINLDANLFRFEISLNSSTKIQRVFGSNILAELTQNQLNQYVQSFIEKNIIAQFDNYTNRRLSEIAKILEKNYVPGSKSWVVDTYVEILSVEALNGLPLLLGINEMLRIVDSATFFKDRNAYNQAKSTLQKKAECPFKIFNGHDEQKYLELKNKLLGLSLAIGSPERHVEPKKCA